MRAMWFRVLDDDGKHDGKVGLAFGANAAELFEEIDRYGDPTKVEVRTFSKGSFLALLDEVHEYEPSSEGWRESNKHVEWEKPKWPSWVLRRLEKAI